ncbi:hypothetical protein [Chryseosolibacter indicus]|uniref:Beta-lactamase-inhibitor-like PepSY-like domain-containing protein n=1 Tax=Chryseosolibacter indicus TaxID=2782351 RepID=A0ABS5VTM1_9BACT|nr:hypothetical protein [Chryseosolibacter indicus]MBT1704763.1 hypothetical protein [Chryseosolibacter indicus]
MKNLIVALSLISCSLFGQATIDLKTLIGKPQGVAIQQLNSWGIKVSPSTEYDNLLVGFDEGLQIEVEEGIVGTIWIEFTNRRKGAYPFSVDGVITPNVDIEKVIHAYGKPDEKADDYEVGAKNSPGWVKWLEKGYQLHCQVDDNAKVFMVTLMPPDWYPGK